MRVQAEEALENVDHAIVCGRDGGGGFVGAGHHGLGGSPESNFGRLKAVRRRRGIGRLVGEDRVVVGDHDAVMSESQVELNESGTIKRAQSSLT